MSIRYTTRPLSDRTWLRPAAARTPSQFKVTWSAALDVLEHEVAMLGGRDLVIEVDVREQDLRLDGTLRANARAEQPAVVVAFESRHGALLYRADQYAGPSYYSSRGMQAPWQHNVYAVARTLEALRAVDRYGAAASGEQYAGYRQIGGGPALVPDAPMTRERAAEILVRASDMFLGRPVARAADRLLLGDLDLDEVIRRAQRLTHPDTCGPRGGPRGGVTFDDVQRAAAVLRGAR